jgi:hypothetical protein
VQAARCELAAAFLDDLRRIDAQLAGARKKLPAAVAAAGTSLTGLFGVGPVIATAVIGDVRDVSRFPGRDHFEAYNATAPIEVSSGQRKVHRLSRRGNRPLNHAIHMAAVTPIRYRHSQGGAYCDKKLAESSYRIRAVLWVSRLALLAGVPVLERGDERQADLLDDGAGASGRQRGFGASEVSGERPVVKDAGYPAGEVPAWVVVAQDAFVTAAEFGLQFGEVRGDGPGRGIGLGSEVEPAGRLDALLLVLVLVAQMGSDPGGDGENHRTMRALPPGQDGPPGRTVEEPGDVGSRHVGHRRGQVDERAGQIGRAEGDDGVEGGERVG